MDFKKLELTEGLGVEVLRFSVLRGHLQARRSTYGRGPHWPRAMPYRETRSPVE